MTEPTKYAGFVLPELSKSRIDAQWARISERRPTERRRYHPAMPVLGLLVAACALAVVWWPRESLSNSESVWEGSIVSSDDAPVDMTLAEGTRIRVDPRSEVKLLHSSSEAVQVRLAHGSARFNVAKKRTRRFSVNLGKVEVVVTGTQFRVLRKAGQGGERVYVEVEEGSVEIRRDDDGVVSLQAGENWSTFITRGDTEPEEAEREIEDDRTPEVEELSGPETEEDGDVVDSDDDGERPLRDHQTSRSRRRRRAREAAATDAAELFDHANLARRAGRLDDASELYADLVERYPRDRRASLAAFELGRLRMDSLRDVRGAVQALERALKLDAHGAFAEDALARLVLAEEARGDREACSRARTRYLARYPDGVHAQHVTERCSGK